MLAVLLAFHVLLPRSPHFQKSAYALIISIPAVASFALPATSAVVEGGSAVMVCSQMITVPPVAILCKEIVVKLFTVDAIGMLDNGVSLQ